MYLQKVISKNGSATLLFNIIPDVGDLAMLVYSEVPDLLSCQIMNPDPGNRNKPANCYWFYSHLVL
jgi:hypothetical protein